MRIMKILGDAECNNKKELKVSLSMEEKAKQKYHVITKKN